MAQRKTKTKDIATAGLVGTAVGVGIGAAAMALSSSKNRKALKKKSADIKEQTTKILKNGKKRVADMKNTLEETVDEKLPEQKTVKKQVKKAASAVSASSKK